MALPLFSPAKGYGSTYTDKNTGATYSFGQGSTWNPISSGVRQGPQTLSSVTSASAGRLSGGNVLGIQNTLSGGSGGGGSDLNSLWNKLHPGEGDRPVGWLGENEDAAREQAKIELEQALNAYDYEKENALAQREKIGTEKATALSDLDTAYGRSETQAGQSKIEAEESTQKERGRALSTAQDTQKSNRNILRALGILSSSAAGEMLTKPLTEYGKISGELGNQLIKRKDYIDNWLKERLTDHQSAVRDIQNNYASVVDSIDRDLRFNDRERTTAIKAAQASLSQRIAEIQQSAMQYQQAAKEYNNQILDQIAELTLYQNPQANISGIINAKINTLSSTPYSQTASIYQGEDQKKRQSNTLSGY